MEMFALLNHNNSHNSCLILPFNEAFIEKAIKFARKTLILFIFAFYLHKILTREKKYIRLIQITCG